MTDIVWLVGKIEKTCMLLFDTCLYFNMKLIIKLFRATLHPCYNSCIFIKKSSSQVFRVPIQSHNWLPFQSPLHKCDDFITGEIWKPLFCLPISYEKKFSVLISVVFFCPPKFKTLYSGSLAIADTFFKNRRCQL